MIRSAPSTSQNATPRETPSADAASRAARATSWSARRSASRHSLIPAPYDECQARKLAARPSENPRPFVQFRALLAPALAALATFGTLASTATAQEPQSTPWDYSTLTDVKASVCLVSGWSDKCVSGFRDDAMGSRLPAAARVQVQVTATCSFIVNPLDPGQGTIRFPAPPTGEVRVVLNRPTTWRPCEGFGVAPLDGSSHETSDVFERHFAVSPSRNGRRSYAVAVTSTTGQRIVRRLLVVRSRFSPRLMRTIWDYQFDRYINVCIDGRHKLHARGGHLYCVDEVSPPTSRVAFLLR